ncbi:allantoicase [Coprinopsis cinerea okayama7|uniref:Allantoicase n=1 Tax=Coprinopsis cinerea (strain Okayama-7 / 130 / ATCC MYA-4618 / FGSC 9003) TaxID=240176 RepID=A8N764_COPC7|nr:allantoicase [Coprinopsis cinerea okayama7\|eukprot:XP_001830670.2 allantoicase [Coprinopsis cinerea okayama7\
MSAIQSIPLDHFKETFSTCTELSSTAIGGRIVSVSDEFFAEAFNLLKVEPSTSLKGSFGPNGALYDGWETRRHNPAYDWVIVQLGTSGNIIGFDVDTSNFNGNEAPEASIEVIHGAPAENPSVDDAGWKEVLPRTRLGPNSRHMFKVPTTDVANFVKLKIYPDGGVARFRVYGHVSPVHPIDGSPFDLAHVFAGGRVLEVSDQHFGVGANLLLPGRGKDMGDGWETKRSRTKGHTDWVIIKLGAPGYLEHVEIDTAHFKGNFPESCELHGLYSDNDLDVQVQGNWTEILPRTKLGPHRQHYFQLENVENTVYSHVKMTIYPDGGVKRVRVIGRKADSNTLSTTQPQETVVTPQPPQSLQSNPFSSSTMKVNTIPVLPLTPEGFAPFGSVIQGYSEWTAAPKGAKITKANADTADKFHKQTLLTSSYPPSANATTGISVYRCRPLRDIGADGTVALTVLERHRFTNQTFIPMGRGDGEGLKDPAHRYLVVVAHNGEDDRPDLRTLRAFLATSAQGVTYNEGVWHQPMTVLDKVLDLACVETQIGDGSASDCEILELDTSTELYKLQLPAHE